MEKFSTGQTAWIIESGLLVREVTVMKVSGNLATIRFPDTGGAIRIPSSRLYDTKENAEYALKQHKLRK